MTITTEKPLSKVEVWIAEHALPIFIAIAILIVLGAIAVFITYEEQSSTAEQVKVLKPQVTRVNKAICDEQTLRHPDRARRCAERIRVGLINCRRVERCRAALIAAITFPPSSAPSPASHPTSSPGTPGHSGGGDAFQPSSHGHQHEGPGSQPGPAPTPSPEPAPGHSGEERGNPTAPGQEKKSPSGVGVEVCVEAVGACANAGLSLPKGLTP